MKENMSSKIKLPWLVPVVTILFYVLNRVLISGVTAPTHSGATKRYYLFISLKFVALVGMMLLPLWLGYNYKTIKKRNPWTKLSEYWLIYVIAMIVPFIFFFFTRNMLNIRDLWLIAFPVSLNYFAYAVGFVLTFLLLPVVTDKLSHLSDRNMKNVLLVLGLVTILLPTIFSKDIWGFNDGKSFLWQTTLMIFGYGIQRFNIIENVRFVFLKFLFSGIIACGMAYVMGTISMDIRGDISTAQRFSVPYSIFGFVLSIYMFLFLERIQKKVQGKLSARILAVFLIVAQVITTCPLVTHCVSNYYRQPQVISIFSWGYGIIRAGSLYLLAIFAVTGLLFLIKRIKLFTSFEERLSVDSFFGLVEKGKAAVNYFKTKKRLIVMLVSFYALISFQMFVVTIATTDNPKNVFLKTFFTSQPQILLNVAIMTAVVVLLFLITNKFWYAVTFTTVVYILLTISSYLKISMRQEPVLPEDLKMLTSIDEIISMVQPTLIILGLLSIAILAIGAWLLQRRTRNMYNLKVGLKKRLIGIMAILVMFSGVFFLNHRNTPPNILVRLFRVNKQFFYDQVRGARINGPLVQFLLNIDVEDMEKPKDYSEKAIEKLMLKYDSLADELNQSREDWQNDQTFIFNLSESFTDPTRIPETQVTQDPMPNIRKLLKQNPSGLMVSPGYGGGTANIEWESLTGLAMSNLSPTLVTPYSQLVEKQPVTPNITDLFENKIAIHPYVAKLYNRVTVFEQLGFQKFYYVGSKDKLTYTEKIYGSKYISDESAYQETLKHLKENQSGTQFIQLSTMQNHTPYTHAYPSMDFDFTGPSVISENHHAFQTYMQGIKYTDDALQKFINELDKIERPITFVFYGDHFPSLFSGLNMDKYGLELHETDYFIYNNRYIRDRQDVSYPIISPNNFSPLALMSANLKLTPYYALLTRVMEELPSLSINPVSSSNNRFNGNQVFVKKNGTMIDEEQLSKKQKELLEEYRLIQYDLAVGNQYAADWAMQSVSENAH